MNKVPITENFLVPNFQTVNKNQQSTEFILMDPQTGHLYLLHQYYCRQSQDYSNLVALLQAQAMNDNQSPYILNPVVYLPIRFTNQEFQTSHFVQVLYEYGSHTLSQEMYLRIQQKNYFEEHEIWSILGSCVLGLKSLRDRQFNHSSVCLNDILVTKQGEIKLTHPMIRTYDHYYGQCTDEHYLQKVIQQGYYFSPQQLGMLGSSRQRQSSLLMGNANNNGEKYDSGSYGDYYDDNNASIEDFFKCDLFSLGMSVVSLCLLGDMRECYYLVNGQQDNNYPHNYSRFIRSNKLPTKSIAFDSHILQQCFTTLQQVYSHQLLSILAAMLTYAPQQRISIDQLAEIIQQMIVQDSLLSREEKCEEENVGYCDGNQYGDDEYQQYQQQNYAMMAITPRESRKLSGLSPVGKRTPVGCKENEPHNNINKNNHTSSMKSNSKIDNNAHQLGTSRHQSINKFTQVSQASPISCKKTKQSYTSSSHKLGKSNYKNKLGLSNFMINECLQMMQPDNEDKPSLVMLQCVNDYEQVDQIFNGSKEQQQQSHYSQRKACCFDAKNLLLQASRQQQGNKQQQQESQQKQQQQPINHTLQFYINQNHIQQNFQLEGSSQQVNQTKTYEQYQLQEQEQLKKQPKQVLSVMTSKELCSLPSESISIVEEKHKFRVKTDKKSDNKESKECYGIVSESNQPKDNSYSQKKEELKLNFQPLNDKQNQQTSLHPLSSRTFIKKDYQLPTININNNNGILSQINKQTNWNNKHENQLKPMHQQNLSILSNVGIRSNPKMGLNKYGHNNMENIPYPIIYYKNNAPFATNTFLTNNEITNANNHNANNNHMSSSLSKDYQVLIKNQNPNSVFTDPKFLQTMRQDVNKILTKRGLQVTSSIKEKERIKQIQRGKLISKQSSSQKQTNNGFDISKNSGKVRNQVYINNKKVADTHNNYNTMVTFKSPYDPKNHQQQPLYSLYQPYPYSQFKTLEYKPQYFR